MQKHGQNIEVGNTLNLWFSHNARVLAFRHYYGPMGFPTGRIATVTAPNRDGKTEITIFDQDVIEVVA